MSTPDACFPTFRPPSLPLLCTRLSEERQLLLALRCGWFQTPWLQGQGRPTFKALAQLWGRSGEPASGLELLCSGVGCLLKRGCMHVELFIELPQQ